MEEQQIEDLVQRSSELEDIVKDLPIDLVKNLPVIAERLNAFITFYSTLNLKRLSKLTNFVLKAEEVLFDESNIINKDEKDLQVMYRQAKTASLEILDLARKIAIQLPSEDTSNKQVDEVYKLLKSLSPDSLEELKENLLSLKSKE